MSDFYTYAAKGRKSCDCGHILNNHLDGKKNCCECSCIKFEKDIRTLKEKIAFSDTVKNFLRSIGAKTRLQTKRR